MRSNIIGEYVEFIYCGCKCGFTTSKYRIENGKERKDRPKKFIFGHVNKDKSKGNNVTYKVLHKKMNKIYPQKEFCEFCNLVPPNELACITYIYDLDTKNWRRLCYQCHFRHDDLHRKGWVTRRKNKREPKRDPKTNRFVSAIV